MGLNIADIQELRTVNNHLNGQSKSVSISQPVEDRLDIIERKLDAVLQAQLAIAERRAWVQDIKRRICGIHKVTMRELESAVRTEHIVLARHIAIYLCCRCTPLSLPRIGASFGKRDHSSIIHAREKIAKMMAADAGFNGEIRALMKEFGA